jgi:D-lactate dehydrogenase
MKVLAYDIRPNPAVEAMDIPYLSIEEILPQADVVSLHVPLLPSTYELMNKPRCVFSEEGGIFWGSLFGRGGVVGCCVQPACAAAALNV